MNDPRFPFPEGCKENIKKRRGKKGIEIENPKWNFTVKASICLSSL